MIEIKNLNKYYSKGRSNEVHAVNDVSLTLPDSGMVAIFGKSGCGKTTLLNVIGGLDRYTSGSVSLDGSNISPEADRERNISVGYIFQNYNLSKNLTVYENVALSLRLCGVTDELEIENRVMAALSSVDMDKFRRRLPDALSGGQQQRVAIARAIVKNPKLILADEPTGNLDEQNTVMVMDLLKEISREHLVLLVTHEADLVDLYCDRVIEIVDGRVESERENTVTEGFSGKRSSEIYLGDMEKTEVEGEDITLEYFGDRSDMPRGIRLISSGGVLYIKADEGIKLKVIDSSAELKIHEGKFEEKPQKLRKKLDERLTAPISEGKTGRMYTFRSSVRSGYTSNFGKKKIGKRLLFALLGCFAMVIVFVMSLFGSVFINMRDIKENYSSNIIYIPNSDLTGKDVYSIGKQNGADCSYVVRYSYGGIPQDGEYLNFRIGNFETFVNDYNIFFGGSAIVLPEKAQTVGKAVCGKASPDSDGEIVITTGYADKLLRSCGVSYIDTYEDLLFTVGSWYGWGGEEIKLTVVGIVENKESEIYLTDYQYVMNRMGELFYLENLEISDAEHIGEGVKEPPVGTVYVSQNVIERCGYGDGGKVTFKINGVEFVFEANEKLDEIAEKKSEENGFIYDGEFDGGIGKPENETEYKPDDKPIDGFESEFDGAEKESEGVAELLAAEEIIIGGAMGNDTIIEVEPDYDYGYDYDYNHKYSHGIIVMNVADMEKIIVSNGENTISGINEYSFGGEMYYAFHSADVDNMKALFSAEYKSSVVTPDDMYEFYSQEYSATIIGMTVFMIAALVIMSLCMYFIMRSSLMGDIKEVGISRAIGVSRKNLVFRYFVETMVLFVLTVFVGYLISSGIIIMLSSLSPQIAYILYYPWWMALISLGILFLMSVICGLIPIRGLLRKSPAEILAKYDI